MTLIGANLVSFQSRLFRAGIRLCVGLLMGAFLTAILLPGAALAAKKGGNPKYASIVMDADTGMILSESNPDKRLHPASLTKIMTLLMVFDGLNRGTLNLNDRVRISRHAASMDPSKLNLPVGSTIKLKDAILALVTKSANDISAAVAEHIGGTESQFAKMMTARAREIGMKNSTFRNAHGLHHPEQISTARDMAILGRYIITHYPDQYKYFSTRNFVYQGKAYHNHNRLMEKYKGMDGIKTGFINPSGFNLVASAVQDNRRVIGVVFGGRTTASRNAHMAELLDAGFAKLKSRPKTPGSLLIAEAPQPVPAPSYTAPQPLIPAAPALTSSVDYETAPVQRYKAPLPDRKPSQLLASANLNALSPTSGGNNPIDDVIAKTAMPKLKPVAPAQAGTRQPVRLKMPAPAAVQKAPAADASYALASNDPNWAVQVGAFASRVQTDRAIGSAIINLPESLRHANPIIIPLKQGQSWLFRGRLSGFTREEAMAACRYIQECIPVGPRS